MTYKVPLIPQNLRKNETIVQIADSLDYLSRVVDDIFMHVENRIKLNNAKLEDVIRRVDNAERKISTIRGAKNATQLFSSSKYPGADINRRYHSIYPLKSEIVYSPHKVKHKYPRKNDEVLEKFHIYHVQLSKLQKEKVEGLGELPNEIDCINDILLYNSSKTLYKNFKVSNSLKVSSIIKSQEQRVSIGDAPVSIGEKTPFFNVQEQSYFYHPDLGEVPSLDIPQDLPDLPGIANNVRYIDDAGHGISPSVISSLPGQEIISTSFKQGLDELPEIVPCSTTEISETTPVEVSDKQKECMKLDEAQIILPSEDKNVTDINQILPTTDTDTVKSQAKDIPVVLDTRASLMEAIRAARGGQNLKTVNKNEVISKNVKPSGDLMADLHAKLTMRRKGISGTYKANENEGLDTRQALSMISALIPPAEDTNEETDQDEEWE